MVDYRDRCDPEILAHGHSICYIDGRANDIEEWVKKVAAKSGQRMDWGYSCGIADIQYIGEYEKIVVAIWELEPALKGRIHRRFSREEQKL